MAVYKINESVEEVKEESTKVEEAVTNDYRVVSVTMDVAMPANKSLDDYGTDTSHGSGKLYRAISGALESVGLKMAGDYVDAQADHTDVYKDNDYEFEFNESLKEDLGTDVDEYQQWVDYDMKRYGKISDQTNKEIKEAGLQIVKDKYGDYQVIASEYDESLKDESLTENAVSNYFSPALDSFLQDMAQMYGKMTYNDIMDSRPEEKDLDRLNRLHREYNKEAQYESPDNEKVFKQIADEVAYLVKRNKKKEEESVKETPEESTRDVKEETLTPEYTSDLLDMAQVSFETGVRFDEGDFEDSEDFGKYQQLMDLGPVGFYEEYKDTLDFDPDFVAEYGVEESLKESDSTVRNFTIEDVDGDVVDYKANSAKEATERYKKDHPGSEILSVYDEGDIYYDIETGDELEG